MTLLSIKDVCNRFSSGKGISADNIKPFGKYPVYGGNGIRGFTDEYNFEGECAIIGRQGAYCGNVHYFSGKAFMTEHAIVASVKPEHNAGYLAYLLSLMDLSQFQGQSAQPGLSVKTLSEIVINMPDKDVQDKIFSYINNLDKKIECNNKISAELEALAKTIYDYWFLQFEFPNDEGKPYRSSGGKMVWSEELKREIPEGWRVGKLGELITIARGVTYGKEDVSDIKKLENTCLLRANNISNGQINTDSVVYVNNNKISVSQILHPGDVLICMSSGSKEHIGKTAIVTAEMNYAYGAFCSKIEMKKNFSGYVAIMLRGDVFSKYIRKSCLGTNINNLTNDIINNFKVLIPPKRVLEPYNMMIDSFVKRCGVSYLENVSLISLRDFLLPLLMNGQVGFEE